MHALETLEHEIDALLQRDPEPCHARVGDRQLLGILREQAAEERHDRAARPHHVAVAHDRKPRAVATGDIVGGHEQLVGSQLGGAIEVDRVGRLVRGERDDFLHLRVDGGLDHVLRAADIGLQAFERVVFGHRHMLQRRGVHDIIDAVESLAQARPIAHVADEIAHAALVEDLRHLELLQFVTRIDDHAARLVARQHRLHELLAERPGAAGDQDRFAVKHALPCTINIPQPESGRPRHPSAVIAIMFA